MTAQFDVFENPDKRSAESHPYLVVLQSNALHQLNTRVVAPLVPPKELRSFDRLFPKVTIRGRSLVVDATNLGVVSTSVLSDRITNLESERYRIIGAVDLVLTGV